MSLRAYARMHGMFERFELGLYRGYPDPVTAERQALVRELVWRDTGFG